MGTFLLGFMCHLCRKWGTLHHDVVDIQTTFDKLESGERSKDRSRAIQWFHVSALIIMRRLIIRRRAGAVVTATPHWSRWQLFLVSRRQTLIECSRSLRYV
jgi:hypothetical protein